MKKAILGTKIGMTQIFMEDGKVVPVTVISAEPNVVVQKKTVETDGYDAVQVGFLAKKEKLANKPMKGAVQQQWPQRWCRSRRVPE